VLQQVPEAPAHFDGYARAEWDRVAVEQRPQLPQDEDAGDSEP
jgi:phage terminase small subunit